MGKKQKIRSGAGDVVALPGPLDKQIEKAKIAKKKLKLQKHIDDADDDVEKEEKLNDALDSAKVLKMARKQRESEESAQRNKFGVRANGNIQQGAFSLRGGPLHAPSSDDEEEEDVDEEDFMAARNIGAMDEELQKISAEDEAAIGKFLRPRADGVTKTLYDLIQEKIVEKKVSFKETFGGNDVQVHDLNPEVVELYTEVGKVMAGYRCGKVPKAFKIIPSMVNWEQILELTSPENWSAAAMLQATRLFSACMSPVMCQRFFNLVLLPRVRDDIDEYKKLNFHLYECLFKAIYKPAAFFKGILLPLCESGTCTIREAAIVGSVLRKISIPVLHAAAAMLKIAEMEYCGSSSLILRILIEKRYTLPFRAIDGLVFSFLRMRSHRGKEELPVLWHQSLLSFVEQYKSDISSEQREALLELLKLHSHHLITPEIRRHLRAAESRNEESEANVPHYAREDGMEF